MEQRPHSELKLTVQRSKVYFLKKQFCDKIFNNFFWNFSFGQKNNFLQVGFRSELHRCIFLSDGLDPVPEKIRFRILAGLSSVRWPERRLLRRRRNSHFSRYIVAWLTDMQSLWFVSMVYTTLKWCQITVTYDCVLYNLCFLEESSLKEQKDRNHVELCSYLSWCFPRHSCCNVFCSL